MFELKVDMEDFYERVDIEVKGGWNDCMVKMVPDLKKYSLYCIKIGVLTSL